MIKVLLIAESASTASMLKRKIESLSDVTVAAALLTEHLVADEQQKIKHDFVIISNAVADSFFALTATSHRDVRQQVISRTHQGMQLVDVENIYYFQAEHKYVTAYHATGQLLIEDSLDSLEQEFTPKFLRIHRKILVAKHKVERLYKDALGHYLIKLQDVAEPLMVSRRKVSQVRRMLSC